MVASSRVLKDTTTWLDNYFSGKIPGILPNIRLNTTPFCLMVYELILKIPYGSTSTYEELARMISESQKTNKISAQAVGNAARLNPIQIIIPCHRVIGKKGKLTGYAGGIERKAKLLDIESTNINRDSP